MKTIPDLLEMFNRINTDSARLGYEVIPLSEINYYANQILNIFELSDFSEAKSLAKQVNACNILVTNYPELSPTDKDLVVKAFIKAKHDMGQFETTLPSRDANVVFMQLSYLANKQLDELLNYLTSA